MRKSDGVIIIEARTKDSLLRQYKEVESRNKVISFEDHVKIKTMTGTEPFQIYERTIKVTVFEVK